ncbi:MAG: hypothetical protein ACFFCY_09510 [Promethearchaeota archaeon]
MIKDIIEFYRIGKELGLTNKEMRKIFLIDKSKKLLLYRLIILIIIISWVICIIILKIGITRNTYPSGTAYSSVRMKDFKMQNKKSKS